MYPIIYFLFSIRIVCLGLYLRSEYRVQTRYSDRKLLLIATLLALVAEAVLLGALASFPPALLAVRWLQADGQAGLVNQVGHAAHCSAASGSVLAFSFSSARDSFFFRVDRSIRLHSLSSSFSCRRYSGSASLASRTLWRYFWLHSRWLSDIAHTRQSLRGHRLLPPAAWRPASPFCVPQPVCLLHGFL